MSNKLRIYTLEGLTPEIKAVCFAKCSRSPEPFDEIAKELTEEKSSEFHEKWVVGYGHSSVAEHAVLSIAVENLSILATKVLEDNRLASYTEKSTRYQIFDKNTYYKPERIINSPFAETYERTGDYLFQVYEALTEPMMNFVKKKYPKPENMGEKLYESVSKARACDNIRYLLPTATQTNLGLTMNARALEWAIAKLLSHPLEEMQEIGREIKNVGQKITPTLIKYAEPNEYLQKTDQELRKLNEWIFGIQPANSNIAVKLVNYDKSADNKLIASLLYKTSTLPYSQIKDNIERMPMAIKEAIINEALKYKKPYDRPLRELEHIYYTFDILMDYGAFRDIQRHRMATQTNQAVTTVHGYSIPDEIIEAGYETGFKNAMAVAEEAYQKLIKEFPEEAQYIVPLAYKKRTLITWNLRELHHFIPLRSGKKGHISYRRIAQECWREVESVHPLLAKYIAVDMDDTTFSTVGNK
ncbi:MAG: hypothetical protein COU51_04825 [Parcubacteria group bacterium CG10_big_fil_rev_8_21_14_0_10_36_14]|nr:MAG: hypothetical protein COU51_04825 [Parcubacteria group bacterium CG10_big_fil_rev_8_21_14_0_10_36_14]